MQTAKILSKTMLTDEMLELKLETSKIDSLPGQWMFINYLGLEKPFKRAYSIANSETQGEVSILTFLIKLVDNGQGSNQLKILQIGAEVGLEGPNGHFTLKNTQNPKVFLSTGSGLAPCYRMAKEDQSWAKKWFFFSVSYEKDLFYTKEIKALNIEETHISVSREDVANYEKGRIQIDEIDFAPETEFYICGVPLMVKDFMTKLRARGYSNIYVEAY